MGEQPRGAAIYRRGGVLFGTALACAVVVLVTSLVTEQPRLVLLGAGAFGGTWSAWRATQLWRAAGRRGPMFAAAALCGFLGSAFFIYLVTLTLVVLRGGVF